MAAGVVDGVHLSLELAEEKVSGDFMARFLGSAVHPSARHPARVLDLEAPYRPMRAPFGSQYPRATVRPAATSPGQDAWWAVKIWAAEGVPLRMGPLGVVGPWVAKRFQDRGEAMNWAVAEVRARRPKALEPESPAESPC